MFSLAARTAASRLAVRSTVQSNAFASLRYSQPVRTFAATTFLNPEEVTDRIVTVVKNFDKVDPDKVESASKFAEDLGLDSLDSVEVVMAIEDEFAIEIPDAEADKIASIEDAVEYIAGHPMAK
uniref:Acyl carrier protein n=1 Tax=Odontella aurita TaxID=265563 RepID=A0A6U6F713_9STRA|mmetsp:Transcript_31994/g.95818  ORF Transcript_31994/g.95818 Transcript_31994/m.95818 type:complete len:124 (+) Transcript_31994:133-504(+)|eukprot:CAMPEP_0113553976 /NCGR_PEP_ID=MMETSP0015_2-20120614/15898_1 /TAXON_ID=2838 /ORGANISM="Odontella" /LENGTH=123 /DNA_ID=CAMNT_0000455077 /DNA_START=74 /DNA_END=445 /DNA_ORIENTATION=- /assembly_acc=CAM_ASM_000160